jgi:imidazolonepropionase-like amidohydrolase
MGIVFENCRLIDCTGAPAVPDTALFVEQDIIRAVGPRGEVLRSAGDGHRLIDVGGATIMPGLWDAHVHLGSVVPPFEERFRTETETNYAFRALTKAQQNLLVGITSIRTMSDRFNADIQLKRLIGEGHVIGPRIFAAGDASWSRRGVTGEEEFRRRTREIIHAGADHVKLFATVGIPSLPGTVTQMLCTVGELRAATEEAHRWNKPVAVHAIGDEGVVAAAESGADTIEHGFVLGDEGVAAMARHNVVFSPQMCVTGRFDEHAMRAAGVYREWHIQNKKLASAAHHAAFNKAVKAGITIIAGVDNLLRMPLSIGVEQHLGRTALVSELDYMIQNGLSPIQALMAATINSAAACRADRTLGTLEPGKLADLIVVDGDPLSDIQTLHNVTLVMKDGRIVREPGRAEVTGG